MRYFLIVFIISNCAFAQEKLGWDFLFAPRIDTSVEYCNQEKMAIPLINDSILSYSGVKVKIHGFLIPVVIEEGVYALSNTPYMYRCTSREVYNVQLLIKLNLSPIKRYKGFKLDQVLTFNGVFRVKENDPDCIVYQLDDAILIDTE